MKNYCNFSTNNGTMLTEHIGGNDRHALNKYLREFAMGQRFPGQEASWWVNDISGHTVFEGKYFPGVGIRYQVFNYKNSSR